MQNVARRYGLVCLLHEKPFAGVNGSGKHNNWSMGTDTGLNLLEPGDTPHENLQFLFFCAAVIQAVDKHQELLRASVATAGPGPPPGRQRGAAGDHLDLPRRRAGEGLRRDRVAAPATRRRRRATSSWARSVLPPLPMHGGDRNRTSPFAFTGNKFEFRALGSSHVAGAPEHGAQHDRRRGDRRARRRARGALEGGGESLEAAVLARRQGRLRRPQADRVRRRQLRRGVARGGRAARAREPAPDARRAAVADRAQTVEVFGKYEVLSERELESRYEVFVEQYVTTLNIEARDGGLDRPDDAAAGGGPVVRHARGRRRRAPACSASRTSSAA